MSKRQRSVVREVLTEAQTERAVTLVDILQCRYLAERVLHYGGIAGYAGLMRSCREIYNIVRTLLDDPDDCDNLRAQIYTEMQSWWNGLYYLTTMNVKLETLAHLCPVTLFWSNNKVWMDPLTNKPRLLKDPIVLAGFSGCCSRWQNRIFVTPITDTKRIDPRFFELLRILVDTYVPAPVDLSQINSQMPRLDVWFYILRDSIRSLFDKNDHYRKMLVSKVVVLLCIREHKAGDLYEDEKTLWSHSYATSFPAEAVTQVLNMSDFFSYVSSGNTSRDALGVQPPFFSTAFFGIAKGLLEYTKRN
jgi:hypothetical protein